MAHNTHPSSGDSDCNPNPTPHSSGRGLPDTGTGAHPPHARVGQKLRGHEGRTDPQRALGPTEVYRRNWKLPHLPRKHKAQFQIYRNMRKVT